MSALPCTHRLENIWLHTTAVPRGHSARMHLQEQHLRGFCRSAWSTSVIYAGSSMRHISAPPDVRTLFACRSAGRRFFSHSCWFDFRFILREVTVRTAWKWKGPSAEMRSSFTKTRSESEFWWYTHRHSHATRLWSALLCVRNR